MLKAVAFAHALADVTRWRIAQLIASDALCVCELADIFQLPQSTLSTHLQVMRRTGVASVERCDKWSYYRLAKEVAPVWKALNALAEADPESGKALEEDRKRAEARLALRGQTDCQGPRRSIPPGPPPTRKTSVPRRKTAVLCK